MKRFIGLVLFLSITPLSLYGDEVPVPNFSQPPHRYQNNHQIIYLWDKNRKETVVDILLIGSVAGDGDTVYINTIGNNSHMCYVSGKVVKAGDHYSFRYRKCDLKIFSGPDKARTVDVGGNCKELYCGYMGNLDVEFVKQR